VSDPRAAIFMVSRDEHGQLHVVDGRGQTRAISTDADLRRAIEDVLDDPETPPVEQVAQLEHAAEQVLVQAAASFLPEVARPLAGPLVRDVGKILRAAAELPQRRRAQPASAQEPSSQRLERARAARMRNSGRRTGVFKRSGNAA
jgi:hypothetical protein